MTLLRDMGRRAKRLANPMIIALLCAYFAYHAVVGERGVQAWMRLDKELASARSEAAALAAERAALERRVALLSEETLDRDMLDERARHMLNLGRPDEIVIFDDAKGN